MAYHHIRSWRRHQDWTKALHKRRLDREVLPDSRDTYDNLHQYSKNKLKQLHPVSDEIGAEKYREQKQREQEESYYDL